MEMVHIKSKLQIAIYAIFMSLILAVSSIAFAEDGTKKAKNNNKSADYYYKQFGDVFERIEKDYIQEADYQEMTNEAINGMLHSLDPYSGYFTEEDMEFFLEHTDGEFGGIGVEIMYDSGAIKVISPIDDLPAYRAGIKSGDYIVGIDGHLVSTLGFNKSVRKMRGEPGTKLSLLVVKEHDNKTEEIELKREIVKIDPVKFEIEQDDFGTVGYIRIAAFNKHTFPELKKAIAELEKKSKVNNKALKGLILDVRDNPGGLVDQAVLICEYFINHGVVVSTKGRNKSSEQIFSASRFSPKAPKIPMVVLINGGSASASEIVAGALQDHKRAIILGTTSFGKGLVQTFTPISSKAAVKLTTAKYYLPNGRSINAKGVIPDVFIENAKVEYGDKKEEKEKVFSSSSIKEYLKKYNTEDSLEKGVAAKGEEEDDEEDLKAKAKAKGSSIAKMSKKNDRPMSEKYKKDYQYARAYDLMRGLIISKIEESEEKADE